MVYEGAGSLNQTGPMLDTGSLTADATSARAKSDADGRAILQTLRQSILDGAFAPGERLPTERALASRFGAARNTVRKTMQRLVEEGLIVRHVGRGSFVARQAARPDAAFSLGELLEARLMFEPELAEIVAERASDEELAALPAHLAAIAGAASWRDFKEAKYALHLAIIRASRNSFLIAMFEAIVAARRGAGWDRPGGHRLPIGAVREAAARDNGAIVEALTRRDGAAARDLIRQYLLRTLMSVDAS